mmetsp:Transcript_34269/g.39011  ORF Transcript_34269/g.39011 Transcript_34269/m.39011 type:complete len:765 (+) Transcript_34269:112-2406(+)
MAPSIKVPIPNGQLNIAFKGDTPKISGLAESSPLYGIMKIGYSFEQLILGDGAIMEGLDTYELVAALNEHAEDKNRKLKMEMSLPAESTIVLQSGAHGLYIEDKFGKALLTRIAYDSPLRKELRVGMAVDAIELEDGYKVTGYSAEEFNEILDSSDNDAQRTLILRDPNSELSSRQCILPMYKKIDLPMGTTDEVGLRLTGEISKIASVKAGGPLAGTARPGFVIEMLKHPDGHEFRGLSGTQMTETIDGTSGADGRVVILKNPETNKLPSMATTKIMLPTNGTLEEMGISVKGSVATISDVADGSAYKGLMSNGFLVSTCGWGDGTEFQGLSDVELDEVIRDSSGLEGRYMVLENQNGVSPSIVNVELQPGKLGAVFKGAPPQLTRMTDESPLNGVVEIGMTVDTLKLSNGKTYYCMDTLEFTNALKAHGDDPSREIRFIKQSEVELTPEPDGQNQEYRPTADELTVELPTGKLSITFKGTEPPAIVSTVKDTSPLLGQVPSGMGVDVVIVNDREHMELNAADLAELLKATSTVPGRIMKLRDPDNKNEFSKIPDEVEIPLPSGKLGCTFSGKLPVAKSFKEGSPIASLIPPGMFVDMLKLADGYCVSGFGTRELVGLLGQFSKQEGRTLVLKNIKTERPSPKEETFPDEKQISLSTGKLGVSFKGSKQARISRLHEDSVLLGTVHVGMYLDTLTIPGGSCFSGMTAKEAARVLVDTKNVDGRLMVLKSPENKTLATRNIDNDDASIGGSSQDMSDNFSRRVG